MNFIESLLLQSSTDLTAWVDGGIAGLWSLLTGASTERVKEIASGQLWLTLLLCFGSGVLTSFTPCVYPMIPITLNIFGRLAPPQEGQAGKFNFHGFRAAAIYVAGMAFTYSILGLVSGLTGSLFGRVLQSPWMLGFLSLLFLAFALGQLGLFKIALPPSLQTRLASIGGAQSLGGIFVMGALSGLIVSPCVGPVIAGILAFVFESSNALLGLLYFLSFSLGLGMLFLVLGGFSGLLAQIPRSGKWMTRVNIALASLLLIASGYYGITWAKQVGLMSRGGETGEATAITWRIDEASALAEAAQKKIPVLIDFTAEWCAACKEIDEHVFHKRVVAERLSRWVTLRIDVTDETPGNLATLQKYGVMSLPTLVFVSKDGNVLNEPRVHGVVPAERFLETLDRVEAQ